MGLWEDANAKYERRRYEEQILKQAQQLAQEIDNNPLHEYRYTIQVDDKAAVWLRQFVQFMRQSGIAPIPCVIPVLCEVSKHWFARDEQIIRAVDARFRGWPIVDKHNDRSGLHHGFAVTEQAKLVKVVLTSRNELLSEHEAEWGSVARCSGIMCSWSSASEKERKLRFYWKIERNDLRTMLALGGNHYPYSSQVRDFQNAERFLQKERLGLEQVLYTHTPESRGDDYYSTEEFLLKNVLSDAVLKVREGRW